MNEYLYENRFPNGEQLNEEEIMIMNRTKVRANRRKNYQEENLDEGIYNDFYSQTC